MTNLHHDSVCQRCVRVDLPDLGVAVAEVELHDLLVDLVLAAHGVARGRAAVDAAVDERGVVRVEPEGRDLVYVVKDLKAQSKTFMADDTVVTWAFYLAKSNHAKASAQIWTPLTHLDPLMSLIEH